MRHGSLLGGAEEGPQQRDRGGDHDERVFHDDPAEEEHRVVCNFCQQRALEKGGMEFWSTHRYNLSALRGSST